MTGPFWLDLLQKHTRLTNPLFINVPKKLFRDHFTEGSIMSIIHDALKKTQNNLNQNNPGKDLPNKMSTDNTSQNSTPPSQNPPNIYDKLHKKPDSDPKSPSSKFSSKKADQKQSSQSSPIKTFFTIILCLLIIVGAILFIYQYYAQEMGKNGIDFKKVLNIHPKKLSINFASKPHHPKPVVKETKAPPANTITLNGVTMMGDQRVALINNEIYQLGESIQGKKIVNISIEKVELEDSVGNITTLKVKAY